MLAADGVTFVTRDTVTFVSLQPQKGLQLRYAAHGTCHRIVAEREGFRDSHRLCSLQVAESTSLREQRLQRLQSPIARYCTLRPLQQPAGQACWIMRPG
jgi:hypothetical protein